LQAVEIMGIKYNNEFAIVVKEVCRGLSISKVAAYTGISFETIRKMVSDGHVPSEQMLERFATGMSADLTRLRVVAGYELPSDPVERCVISLRNSDVSEECIKAIEDFIRRRLEEEKK